MRVTVQLFETYSVMGEHLYLKKSKYSGLEGRVLFNPGGDLASWNFKGQRPEITERMPC